MLFFTPPLFPAHSGFLFVLLSPLPCCLCLAFLFNISTSPPVVLRRHSALNLFFSFQGMVPGVIKMWFLDELGTPPLNKLIGVLHQKMITISLDTNGWVDVFFFFGNEWGVYAWIANQPHLSKCSENCSFLYMSNSNPLGFEALCFKSASLLTFSDTSFPQRLALLYSHMHNEHNHMFRNQQPGSRSECPHCQCVGCCCVYTDVCLYFLSTFCASVVHGVVLLTPCDCLIHTAAWLVCLTWHQKEHRPTRGVVKSLPHAESTSKISKHTSKLSCLPCTVYFCCCSPCCFAIRSDVFCSGKTEALRNQSCCNTLWLHNVRACG